MLYTCMCCSVHSQLLVYDSSVLYSYCFLLCCIVIVYFFIFLGFYLLILFSIMVSFLFSLQIGGFFTYSMVCLVSTLYNWGEGLEGLLLRTLGGWFYHTLPTCTPVWKCDQVEMTWTGMPCTDCCVQSMLGPFAGPC